MPISETAKIHEKAVIHLNVTVWDRTVIREGATIGANTSIGIAAYVGPGVQVGPNCKIQNGALIYEPAIIADGVFIGPNVIFTNDKAPRAITVDGHFKSSDDWLPVGVKVCTGASIGAGSICVAPLEIGEWAMVASGAVVTKDILPFSLVAGIPAKQIGWVGRSGFALVQEDGKWKCPETNEIYYEFEDKDGIFLHEIE